MPFHLCSCTVQELLVCRTVLWVSFGRLLEFIIQNEKEVVSQCHISAWWICCCCYKRGRFHRRKTDCPGVYFTWFALLLSSEKNKQTILGLCWKHWKPYYGCFFFAFYVVHWSSFIPEENSFLYYSKINGSILTGLHPTCVPHSKMHKTKQPAFYIAWLQFRECQLVPAEGRGQNGFFRFGFMLWIALQELYSENEMHKLLYCQSSAWVN